MASRGHQWGLWFDTLPIKLSNKILTLRIRDSNSGCAILTAEKRNKNLLKSRGGSGDVVERVQKISSGVLENSRKGRSKTMANNLTRYNPFNEVVSLRDAMDRLFEDSFISRNMLNRGGITANLFETPDGFILQIPMPGANADTEVADQCTDSAGRDGPLEWFPVRPVPAVFHAAGSH